MSASGPTTGPTDRDILERVRHHLLTQGRQAAVDLGDPDDPTTGACRYRTEATDGTVLRCAVGCLVPDHAYRREIEGEAADGMRVSEALVRAGVLRGDGADADHRRTEMLLALQAVHDRALPERWSAALDQLAQRLDATGRWVGHGHTSANHALDAAAVGTDP